VLRVRGFLEVLVLLLGGATAAVPGVHDLFRLASTVLLFFDTEMTTEVLVLFLGGATAAVPGVHGLFRLALTVFLFFDTEVTTEVGHMVQPFSFTSIPDVTHDTVFCPSSKRRLRDTILFAG